MERVFGLGRDRGGCLFGRQLGLCVSDRRSFQARRQGDHGRRDADLFQSRNPFPAGFPTRYAAGENNLVLPGLPVFGRWSRLRRLPADRTRPVRFPQGRFDRGSLLARRSVPQPVGARRREKFQSEKSAETEAWAEARFAAAGKRVRGDSGISGAFRDAESSRTQHFGNFFSPGNRNFSSCGLSAEYFFVPLRTRNMRGTDYNKLN